MFWLIRKSFGEADIPERGLLYLDKPAAVPGVKARPMPDKLAVRAESTGARWAEGEKAKWEQVRKARSPKAPPKPVAEKQAEKPSEKPKE